MLHTKVTIYKCIYNYPAFLLYLYDALKTIYIFILLMLTWLYPFVRSKSHLKQVTTYLVSYPPDSFSIERYQVLDYYPHVIYARMAIKLCCLRARPCRDTGGI